MSIDAPPLPPLGADIHAKDKHGKTLLQFPKDDKVFRFLYDIDRAEQLRPSATYPRPQGVSVCLPPGGESPDKGAESATPGGERTALVPAVCLLCACCACPQ